MASHLVPPSWAEVHRRVGRVLGRSMAASRSYAQLRFYVDLSSTSSEILDGPRWEAGSKGLQQRFRGPALAPRSVQAELTSGQFPAPRLSPWSLGSSPPRSHTHGIFVVPRHDTLLCPAVLVFLATPARENVVETLHKSCSGSIAKI
jgi:hypothetical protein